MGLKASRATPLIHARAIRQQDFAKRQAIEILPERYDSHRFLPPFSTTNDSPEAALRLTEQRFQVRQVLAELPLRDAELLLARAEGYSYQEVAEQLQIAPASIGTLLARAEAKFRKKYEARYGEK